MEGFVLFIVLFAVITLLVILAKSIRIVPQMQVIILERLGKYAGILGSGPHIIVPFIDAPRTVNWTGFPVGMSHIDLREQYTDLPMQPVITKDNVTVSVDLVIYWQITDPYKAVYEVSDLSGEIIQLTITAMRSVMGEMDLDETLSSRNIINAKLRTVMDGATNKWGVKVTRVEVRNINRWGFDPTDSKHPTHLSAVAGTVRTGAAGTGRHQPDWETGRRGDGKQGTTQRSGTGTRWHGLDGTTLGRRSPETR